MNATFKFFLFTFLFIFSSKNYIYASTNIAVILHGGPDLQKEGTTNESTVKGAREACTPPICNLELTNPKDETEAEYKSLLSKVAPNNDFFITQGYFAQKATHEMADKYPGKKFGIINFEFTPPVKNIASILFAEDQQGFVAGLLAAEISKKKNKKVAVIGGADIPSVKRKVNGFANGVKHACEDCTAYCLYSKSFVNENNESQGIFNAILNIKGIDVVYNAASITGTIALKNLTAHGIYGIGDTTDEWVTNWAYGSVAGSENLLTSIVQDYQVVVRDTIGTMLKNNFVAGGLVKHGLNLDSENSAIKFADCHEACEINTPNLKENMQKYIDKITKRQIDVGIDHKSGRSKISPEGSSCTMLEINKHNTMKDNDENRRSGSDHDHERKSAVANISSTSSITLFLINSIIILVLIFH
ncbi:11655_t:CDS:2 [Ambispora leptoticha]|uniref:11655_t:CDS:1 n=1 Tax=Ambispora leptoticha TaxID=144679 RepID=A0A9N9D1T5_9GLOM|nr:11655_t:CDS:2 [Ambispora leptoticha]